MPKPSYELSVLDQQVLLALIRHHPDGYGVSVSGEIEARTGRRVSIGSIYSALDRLTKTGMVEPREGDPSPVRGGRAKLYFQVTTAGHEKLERSLNQIDSMRSDIKIGGSSWSAR